MGKPHIFIGGAIAALAVVACTVVAATADEDAAKSTSDLNGTASAVFAGGCFWCVEADFDKVDGVVDTVSGFAGGTTEKPSYKDVTYGDTGHYEVVKVVYDPDVVSYGELVEYFWRHVDPTDDGGQFCDRGDSYRTAIFADDEERKIAEASKDKLVASGVLSKPVVTPILDEASFWPAEAYHQNYYKKNPLRYSYYRRGCGRDRRVQDVWAGERGEG